MSIGPLVGLCFWIQMGFALMSLPTIQIWFAMYLALFTSHFFLSFQLLGINTSSRPTTRPKGRTSAIGKGTEKPGESRATTNRCKPLSTWRFVGWPTSCGNIISISRNFYVSSTTSSTSQEWITTHHWPSVTARSSMGVPILGYEKQTNKQTNIKQTNKYMM